MTSRLPLSGIRVLDFTVIWAGPHGVMLLGDLGAEIFRVESCQHHITNTRGLYPNPTKELVARADLAANYPDGDPGERPWNRYAIFNGLGRNKLSLTTDLMRPEGRKVVHELVKVSDVLIENSAPGLLNRLELDYETVHALNPTLVYVSMPIFGLTGPYKDFTGFGGNAEGISGMGSLRGYRDSDPTGMGVSNHMDSVSGTAVAYATLVALHERRRTGRGQFVELGQLENLIQHVGGPLMDAAMNGRTQGPLGNRDAVRAPQGIYPCRGEDRWIAISVSSDEEWGSLCRVMGRSDLAQAPEYEGNLARQTRHDDLDALLSQWTSTRDPEELMPLLQQHGVPAGIVANDKDVFEDPHLDARGFFQEMEHPDCGRHRYPGHSFKYSRTPVRFDTPAPLLGQQNDYVYRQLLGYPEAEIQRLTELGHIGDSYSEKALRGE